MKSIIDWLEKRTGMATALRSAVNSTASPTLVSPYLWAMATVFLFAILCLTGILMMTVYSPSATTAWASVWYLQTQSTLGWLIRGIHSVASNLLILVTLLAVLDLILRKLYRRPGEFLWWASIALLLVVAGFSLTGFLLPWDQRGYWSTNVRANILALTPVVGPAMRTMVLGGSELGHASLTRLYTLHVAILPLVFALFWALHAQQLSRLNQNLCQTPSQVNNQPKTQLFFRRSLICGLLTIILLWGTWYTHAVLHWTWLDAPANPSTSDYPARPEWYALFLFQWLKSFEGPMAQIVGAIAIPGGVLTLALLFPYTDRMLGERLGHRLVLLFTAMGLATAIILTGQALQADIRPTLATIEAIQAKQHDGDELTSQDESLLRAWSFNKQRDRADQRAKRVFELAESNGIAPEGPLSLLANDPQTKGPELFAANCASCHRFYGHNGLNVTPTEPATSSDLGGFASSRWIRGLLANPAAPTYFGLMKQDDGDPAHTRMEKWTAETLADYSSEVDRKKLMQHYDAVAAYLADESQHPGRFADEGSDAAKTSAIGTDTQTDSQTDSSNADEALLQAGRAFFMKVCNECHGYDGNRSGTLRAPEMKGYGSTQWIAWMIATPNHNELYRSRGKQRAQMPPFADKLSERDRLLIANWLHTARETRQPSSR